MSFTKKSNFSQKLTPEQLSDLNDSERLEFPVGQKFIRDGQEYVVTESYRSGPDDYRRVHSTESETDEVMLLNVLKKDAQNADFGFVKEG